MNRSFRHTPSKKVVNALDLTKSLRFADSVINDSFPLSEITNSASQATAAKQYDDEEYDLSHDIPDVNERLAYLKPSRQLLEFYRTKFAEQDVEHEGLVGKLEEYKTTIDQQHKQEWQLRQREEEISELQKALSDIQLSLFQEREQVLRLYAENDRYKIKDLCARRCIKRLIEYNEKGTVTDFTSSPQLTQKSQSVITRVKAGSYKLVIDKDGEKVDDEKTKQTLISQIQDLQYNLESETRKTKERVQKLVDERQTSLTQYEYNRMKQHDQVKTAHEKLYKSCELLYMSTGDILTTKQDVRINERYWMIEKDKLLTQLDSLKDKYDHDLPENTTRRVILNVSNNNKDSYARQKKEVNKLKSEVKSVHDMMSTYQEQINILEDELSRLREQDDLKTTHFHDRTQKVGDKYHIMKKRFEDLEMRRNLEVEGFKNDIKLLRKRLKDLEYQLLKVTLGQTDSYLDESLPQDLDLAVLKQIHETAARSKHSKDDLQDLKLRIYNMERHSVL